MVKCGLEVEARGFNSSLKVSEVLVVVWRFLGSSGVLVVVWKWSEGIRGF